MNLSLQGLIRNDVAPLLKGNKSIGVSVAVITPDQVVTLNQGKVGSISDEPPSNHTLFEIGSVSKVFTATLLAVLVHQGKVDLQAPVSSLIKKLHVGVVVLANYGLGWQTTLFRQPTVNAVGFALLQHLAAHRSETANVGKAEAIARV